MKKAKKEVKKRYEDKEKLQKGERKSAKLSQFNKSRQLQ